MGGISSSFNLTTGAGLSGAGTQGSPLALSLSVGNGLSGTGGSGSPLTIAAPGYGSVGSTVLAGFNTGGVVDIRGNTVSGGSLYTWNDNNNTWNGAGLSGTWQTMGGQTVQSLWVNSSNRNYGYLLVRVS